MEHTFDVELSPETLLAIWQWELREPASRIPTPTGFMNKIQTFLRMRRLVRVYADKASDRNAPKVTERPDGGLHITWTEAVPED